MTLKEARKKAIDFISDMEEHEEQRKTEQANARLLSVKEFINEDYLYTFNVDGDMENFIGTEQIYKDKKLIYELKCHGGIIK